MDDLMNEQETPAGPGAQPQKISPWLRSALIGAGAVVFSVAFLFLIYRLARPIGLLILAITVASAISPLINRLEARINRTWAVLLVYLIGILIIVGLVTSIVPVIVAQAQEISLRAPALVRDGQSWITNQTGLNLGNVADTLRGLLGSIGSLVVSLPLSVVSSLVDIIVVLFLSLYWLMFSPAMHRFLLTLFPQESHQRIDQILHDMGQGMGGYFRASAINGVIVGFLVYIGLSVLGVNFSAVLGLISGVFEIIPALGPTIAGTLIVIIALLQSPKLALFALIFVIVMQQVENHILVPNIMRTQTDISPLLVIFALLCGSQLGGLLGALIAIPVAAALRVIGRDVFAPMIRKSTGAGALD